MKLLPLILAALVLLIAPTAGAALVDADGDGVPDAYELIYGSNPNSRDTDGDGIPDGVENANHDELRTNSETDATKADSDGDGLKDGVEDKSQNGSVDRGETDPRLADSDSDGASDGADNCPVLENADQSDWDFDSLGDPCDGDAYLTLHVRNTENRVPKIVRLSGRRYNRVRVGQVLLLRGSVVPSNDPGDVEIEVSFRSCRAGCPYKRVGYIATAARDNSVYKRGYRFNRHGYYLLQAFLGPALTYKGDETIVQRVLVSG